MNQAVETIPNPPTFYNQDIERWNNKFAKHIQERESFKKRYLRQTELTCLTRNTNIKQGDDEAPATTKKAGSVGHDKNKPSLFGKVLKRRTSRQSNYAPGVIDFDYAGNSSTFQHLINERKDLG